MVNIFRSIIKNPWLLGITLLGLCLRLYLATWPGFKYDVGSFFYWAVRVSQLPLNQFYSSEIFTDYTPGYLYVLNWLGHIREIFKLNDTQFYYLLKLPSIFSEIIMGLIVYFYSKKNQLSETLSLVFASSIFFNPGLIFNSSIWGQVDAVFTLPLILAILFLKSHAKDSKKFIHAGAFLGLAFIIKPQAIAIFPVFVLFALKNINPKIWGKIFISFLVVILVLSWPFFPDNPLFALKDKVVSTASEYPYTALGPYNFWGGVGYWINDLENYFWGVSYQAWGYFLLGGFWLITGLIFFKKNIPLFTLAALATMAFYFLPTRVHERYLYPALVFLVLAAIELKSEAILYAQDIFSIVYFINLYRVYIYYNEEQQHTQNLMIPSVYNFLAGQDKILSWMATIFFVIISTYLLSRKYVQKT